MAAGCEEKRICLSSQMFRAESKKLTEEQQYVKRITHSIAFSEVKKIAYFKLHYLGILVDCNEISKDV